MYPGESARYQSSFVFLNLASCVFLDSEKPFDETTLVSFGRSTMSCLPPGYEAQPGWLPSISANLAVFLSPATLVVKKHLLIYN